jgi:plastocyanin
VVHIETKLIETRGEDAAPEPSRRRTSSTSWTALVVVAVMAAFLLGGAKLLFGSDGGHDHDDHDHGNEAYVALGEGIELDHAVIRVDAVRPEVMAAMSMPASMMPDPIPDGYRRFAVDMFVTGSDDVGFDPRPEMFTVSGDGLDPTPPHRAVVDSDRVTNGFGAYLTMLFETPLGIEPLVLHIEGSDSEVLLEGDLGDGHDHNETPNDIVITGFFEAEIDNYAFAPEDLIVAVGTEVAFHNHDTVRHNVSARDGSWRTDDVESDDRTENVVFDEPGTYEYYCTIHPSMVGTITVVESG